MEDRLEITHKMIEAGVGAYYDIGGPDDRDATDPEFIVEQIYRAMTRAREGGERVPQDGEA